MAEVEFIIEKIKRMPEEHLREIAEFIKSLESKKKSADEGANLLSAAIGICEGPSDLAERHDRYVYG